MFAAWWTCERPRGSCVDMSVICTAVLLPVREEAVQYPADLLSPWPRRLPGTAR